MKINPKKLKYIFNHYDELTPELRLTQKKLAFRLKISRRTLKRWIDFLKEGGYLPNLKK